jgi:hypothetical protein
MWFNIPTSLHVLKPTNQLALSASMWFNIPTSLHVLKPTNQLALSALLFMPTLLTLFCPPFFLP